jgi:hypothetical protein
MSELLTERWINQTSRWASKVPVLRNIPGFNSVPQGISSSNFRFFRLSNLVLTLGMLVHITWIPLFFW